MIEYVHGNDVRGLRRLNDDFSFPQNEDSETPWKVEVFEADRPLDAKPADSVVDGVNIIARAVGPMCLLDAVSRNNRYYSRGLWERAFRQTSQVCEEGLMLGTVGHEGKLDDLAIRDGLISHRVNRLWMNEASKVGMGEIYIFGSPAGKNLATYLRGGAKLRVSSRAFGDFDGKVGKADRIKVDTFVLETFDFVKSPGVSEALPELVDEARYNEQSMHASQQKPLEEHQNTLERRKRMPEDEGVSKRILEDWHDEKKKLEHELRLVTEKNGSMNSKTEMLEARINELEQSNENLTAENNTLKREKEEFQTEVAEYKPLGTVGAIARSFEATDKLVTKVKELGSLDSIVSRLAQLEGYNELGSSEDIERVFEVFETYAKLGSPSNIKECLDLLEQYIGMGTPDEFARVMEIMEEYMELGTTDQIEEVMEASLGLSYIHNDDRLDREAEEVAEEHGVSKSTALALLDKLHDGNDIGYIIDDIRNGDGMDVTERFRKNDDDEGNVDIHESGPFAGMSKRRNAGAGDGRKKRRPMYESQVERLIHRTAV